MDLAAAFLVLCAALLGDPATAFFVNSAAKPVAALAPASDAVAGAAGPADAVAGAVANPLRGSFNPLRFILAGLGVPVDQLVQGSRKCVAALGPEAVGAVKALLGALTLFG